MTLQENSMKCLFVSKDNLWSRELFDKIVLTHADIDWLWLSDSIDYSTVEKIDPTWVFFFHWSKIVSNDILSKFKCVTMHTSNLPDYRGGSPLQHQIMSNVIETRVNAIKMTNDVDGGPIYASLPVTLQGSLSDIWIAIAAQGERLISTCIVHDPEPVLQNLSSSSILKRRKTSQIPVEEIDDIMVLYNFIRMLDADGYNRANINIGNFSIELSRGIVRGDKIVCDAKIRKIT